MSNFNPTQRQIWRRILRESLNLEDVKSVSFDLEIEYEDLAGETKSEKINSLLDTLFRKNRLEPFRAYLLENDDYAHVALPGLGELVGETPYVGLSAFSEESATNFFGREAFVAQLQKAIEKQPFVPVLGPSGSGKSSLIFAGLFPKIRPMPDWMVLNTRPGADVSPLHSLVAAFLNPSLQNRLPHERRKAINEATGQVLANDLNLMDLVTDLVQQNDKVENVLLYIDQFEELFTVEQSSENRHHQTEQFLSHLIPLIKATSRRVRLVIVVTMRADFLGYALGNPELADLLNHYPDVKLRPLKTTRDEEDQPSEIERAIIMPAKNAGASFQEGVVDRIVSDLGDGAGNLPLLQFALTELWNVQENGMLTHQGYDFIGQVEGALVNHAEAVYADLSKTEQKLARDLFTQLVQPGRGTTDTRRIANRDELGAEVWALAQKLSGEDARLVFAGSDETQRETVQVTHEALIANWKRLKGWMDDDRAFREWQEQFRGDVALWLESDESADYLYQGARLAQSSEQVRVRRPNLQPSEQKFIDVSQEAAEAEIRAKEEAQQQELEQARQLAAAQERELDAQKRRSRVIRIALGVISLLLIASVFATFRSVQNARIAAEQKDIAEVQRQEADDQRAEAEAQTLEADKQRTEAETQKLEADRQRTEAETQKLEADRQRAEAETAKTEAETASAIAVAESNRAQTQALMSLSTTTLPKHINPSVDEADLAILMGVQAVRNNDAKNGELLTSSFVNQQMRTLMTELEKPTWSPLIVGDTSLFPGDFAFYKDLDITADGRYLVAAEEFGYIYLWDLTQPDQEPFIFDTEYYEPGNYEVAIAPDGSFFAAADNAIDVGIWDPNQTEGPIAVLVGHDELVAFVDISADGQLLATADWDGVVNIWNVENLNNIGDPIATFSDPDGIWSLAFAQDGQTLYTGNSAGELIGWRVTNGGERRFALQMAGPIFAIDASPDGDTVAVGSLLGAVYLVSPNGTGGESTVIELGGQVSFVEDVLFSADGGKLAAVNDDKSVFVWNLQDLDSPPIRLQGHVNVATSAVFLPSGEQLVSGGQDSPLLLWELETPLTSPQIIAAPDWAMQVAWSPDGESLAASYADGSADIFSVSDPSDKLFIEASESRRRSDIFYSPDGQWLASVFEGSKIEVWDVSQGVSLVAELIPDGIESEEDLAYAEFTPDGQMLVAAVYGDLFVWSTADWSAPPDVISIDPENGIGAFAFSADGSQIAISTEEGFYEVRLYDFPQIDLNQPNQVFSGHVHQVRALDFSPDGKWLASGSQFAKIRIWDLENPEAESALLEDHLAFIWSLDFAPDSQTLVSAADDNTVRVWDANDWSAESQLLEGHQSFVWSAEFSPDGKYIASGSSDNTVRIWPTLNTLTELACDRVTRNMTQTEWDQFLQGQTYQQTCENRPPHPSSQ